MPREKTAFKGMFFGLMTRRVVTLAREYTGWTRSSQLVDLVRCACFVYIIPKSLVIICQSEKQRCTTKKKPKLIWPVFRRGPDQRLLTRTTTFYSNGDTQQSKINLFIHCWTKSAWKGIMIHLNDPVSRPSCRSRGAEDHLWNPTCTLTRRNYLGKKRETTNALLRGDWLFSSENEAFEVRWYLEFQFGQQAVNFRWSINLISREIKFCFWPKLVFYPVEKRGERLCEFVGLPARSK